MDKKRVLIVGLGLIGGSLAWALTKTGRYEVIGTSRRDSTVQEAIKAGAIQRAAQEADWGEVDIVLLCVSPSATLSLLEQHVDKFRPGTVVSDVCGVKGAVVPACTALCQPRGVWFVGAHPMAGREKNGFSHADATLFNRASYILTPLPETPERAVETMRELAMAIGCARVTVTTPEHHDRMIAYTSQIPHVLAGAYAASPCCEEHVGYAAGSYRDVSRVATIDEGLWSELFLLNREALGEQLDDLLARLEAYRQALADSDEEALRALISHGRENKERFG